MKRNGVYIEGLDEFIARIDSARHGAFKAEVANWLQEKGLDFLDIVQRQIIETDTIDTERLLNSFKIGTKDNVWITSSDGLSLEVGTNVEYAVWVNSGHWTTPKGVSQRWVPGSWSGNKFTYDPNATTGMMLKRKWVDGKHYWDSAQLIFSNMFDKDLDRKLDEWINSYFDFSKSTRKRRK